MHSIHFVVFFLKTCGCTPDAYSLILSIFFFSDTVICIAPQFNSNKIWT